MSDWIIKFPTSATRVLVTGHDGYIGKVLVPQLLDAGFAVTGADTLLFGNCSLYGDHVEVPNLRTDIRDITADQLRGFDAVVHLAGLSNDPLGNLDAKLTFDINYRATMRLAANAKAAGVSRFVQASTCSIYGASDNGWLTESSPFNPVTPYGQAKAQVEADLPDLADESFSPTLLRFATAYGVSPRLRGDLVVNNLVGHAVTAGEIFLKSAGTSWRPLVHVDDISRAIVATLQAPRPLIHKQAFNVGSSSENYTVRQVAETIATFFPEASIVFAADAEPDRRNYRVNCDKIMDVLPDTRPQVTLAEGIKQLAAVFRDVHLTRGQLEGARLQRVRKVRELLDEGRLNPDLRWRVTSETAKEAASEFVRRAA